MRQFVWMFAGAFALVSTAALAADPAPYAGVDSLSWSRWQGRLSLGTPATPWRLGADSPNAKLGSASLMGDYYFSRSLVGARQLGGFRATSGLIVGPRSLLGSAQGGFASGNAFSIGSRSIGLAPAPLAGDPAAETTTAPYLGVGYTNLSVRNGWSFNADLGLVAQGSGSGARLGRGLTGGQSLDDAVREMRMTPLLQLGVSYAF
ncbi:hypothetical protein [Rhizobacter fulvus]|jgi:hypothetical protein